MPVDEEHSWLVAHAVPFIDTELATPDPGLSALRAVVGDARLVGMGEATHGTREFWTMRQKMTAYLVREMGFTALLHEAPFASSLPIHDYVTRGDGSAEEAHRSLGYWRYQEMLDLVRWIRDYNFHRGGQEPLLHYLGYDCASADWSGHARAIVPYLQRVDPAVAEDVAARLGGYTLEDAEYVLDLLTRHAEPYSASNSSGEYAVVHRVAEMLAPSWRIASALRNGTPDGDIRESCAADNVNWILEHLLGDGKAVIWAHNAHIGNPTLPDIAGADTKWLGTRLKAQRGAGYYMLGAEFFGGSFLAWEACGPTVTSFVQHRAAPPPEHTYARGLARAGIPLFFLDLRPVDDSESGATWLQGPLDLRFIGATYCAADDEDYWYSASLPVHYDGIVFYENTSPVTRIAY